MPQSKHVLCCHDIRLTTPIRYDRGNRFSRSALKVESAMQWQKWIVRCVLQDSETRRRYLIFFVGQVDHGGKRSWEIATVASTREGDPRAKWSLTGSDVRRIPRDHLCKANCSVSVTKFNVFPRHYLLPFHVFRESGNFLDITM